MRKIFNPYGRIEGYNCFGCSSKNEYGLQMQFRDEGEDVVSEWSPQMRFQGYKNVLHGGIQATLIDEIASWCVQIRMKTAGVTSNLNVRYRKPVYTSEKRIILRSRIEQQRKNLVDVKVELYNETHELCAEALVTYFTFAREVAERNFYYPDYESFFEDQS